jgi:alpha-1,2-glucosyltransferase
MITKLMKHPRLYASIIIFIMLCSLTLSFLYIKDKGLMVDEPIHYDQIKWFIEGNFQLHSGLTTIAGYHAFLAVLGSVFHVISAAGMRLFSLILSTVSIFVFLLLSKKINGGSFLVRTIQYCFFPIIFPFFFLIYTDIFSLLLVLFAFYLLLKKNYDLAGVISILSIFIRQNNIVWLLFMCVYIYYEKNKFTFNVAALKDWMKKCSVFIVGILIFLAFVIINKGFAVGDKGGHPAFSFHLGNTFFMLFLFFFLFLPWNISNFYKIIKLIKKKKKVIVLILGIFLYILTFRNSHSYNFNLYFIRNKLLVYFTANTFRKILFAIPIIYSILSVIVTKLKKKSFYLLYPFAIIYLSPSWLIEPRYYMIPFTLFILFKEKQSKVVEYSTIILYVISSFYFLYGTANGWFFL